jgi:hypothetical protein
VDASRDAVKEGFIYSLLIIERIPIPSPFLYDKEAQRRISCIHIKRYMGDYGNEITIPSFI